MTHTLSQTDSDTKESMLHRMQGRIQRAEDTREVGACGSREKRLGRAVADAVACAG